MTGFPVSVICATKRNWPPAYKQRRDDRLLQVAAQFDAEPAGGGSARGGLQASGHLEIATQLSDPDVDALVHPLREAQPQRELYQE